MKRLTIFSIILAVLLFSSCAISPARKVLPENNLAVNISLGGAIVDEIQGFDFLPIPVNLAAGVTYGVTDRATMGLNLYPVALLGGTLIMEPLGVYNFVQQEDTIPNLNGALTIPVSISFQDGKIGFYPAISVAPTYEDDTGLVYTGLELQFDSTEVKTSLGWKLGGEWKAWQTATIGGELGLIHIGEESVVSPLSRAGIGIPVFKIGSSINIDME